MDVATPLVNEFCARMGMYAGLTPGRNEHQDKNSQRVAWNVHQDFAFKIVDAYGSDIPEPDR